jgi:hypothetical protein
MRQKADILRSLPYDSLAFGTNRLALTSVNQNELIPDEFKLYQNYPNPFNPSTTIKYSVPQGSHIKILLYDILGKIVATLVNEEKNAGNYKVKLNASSLTSGVYFYRIEVTPNTGQSGNFVQVKKMMLLK